MATSIVNVLNVETGETGTIERHIFENPNINNGILVEVVEGTKSYDPEFYVPKTADEFADLNPDKVVATDLSDPSDVAIDDVPTDEDTD